MSTSCDKYESIFVFRDEEELQQHLEACEDCRIKHSEIMKVENLVKSSKPLYLRNKLKNNTLKLNKAIACVGILIFTSFVANNYSELNYINMSIKHPEMAEFVNNSLFNKMALPTDRYGILDPHKEINYD